MSYPKCEYIVPDFKGGGQLMSIADTEEFVKKLVASEKRGHGDLNNALDRLQAKYGIGRWTLEHIRKGKAKSVDPSIAHKIRLAYFAYCESKAKNLINEINIENEKRADDVVDADLLGEAEALIEKIIKRKQQLLESQR